jgi:MFS family permease
MSAAGSGGFREHPGWYLGVSTYWFATSMKWFVLLLVVLPAQVASVVPDHLKNTYWGSVFLIGALWAVVGPAIFGDLSDRFRSRFGRRRPFIAAGAALTVGAMAVLALVRQDPAAPAPASVDFGALGILIFGYLLLQVSDDVATGPYSAIVPEMVPEGRRGYASGILGIARLLAQVVGGVAVFALGGNWIHLYLMLALLNAVCAGWVIWTIRGDVSPAEEALPRRESFFAGWLKPWRSRDFRWVFASSLLLALAFYLVQPYLQNYLRDVIVDFRLFGFDLGSARAEVEADRTKAAARATAVLALSISLFGAVGAAFSSRLADRFGRKPLLYASGAVMFVALVPFALVRDYAYLVLLGGLFGLGYGTRVSAEWALVSDVLPDAGEEAGKNMGLWQMSQSSVQILAGGAGALIDAANRHRFALGYTGAFIMAAVFFVMSTYLVRFVRGSR